MTVRGRHSGRRAPAGTVLAALVCALAGCAPRGDAPTAGGPDTTFAGRRFLPAVAPAGLHRVDALFAPGAQGAFAWLPDGTLWNGDGEFALLRGGDALVALRPDSLGPHRDLPAARRAGDGVAARAFMPWSGGDADTAAWTRLELEIDPGAGATALALRSGGPAGHPLHPDAPVGETFRYDATVAADGREARLLRDGRTLAVVGVAGAAGDGPPALTRVARGDPAAPVAADRRVALVTATAGATPLRLEVWLAPVGGAAADAPPPGRTESFADAAARTAVAWRAELARGAAIETPDARVNAALVAARRLLVGNRERRHGGLHFLGSPFQYRDLYLRDGARVVHALGLLGRADLAGPALESMFDFQWPSGPFLSQRGQLDGTGQALWALATYAAHGGEAKRVDRLLEPAVRGARWIAVQRGSAGLRGGPAAGLLPYGDPRDNELVRGHLLGNDAWALAGLEALGPLLRARGRAATADTVDAEARDCRARLVAVWDREAGRQGRPLPPVMEGGGRDWGNLSAAYPCGVFAPGDPRVVALDRWLRARASRGGLLTYGGRDSLHHYLGFDRTQAAVRRGERALVLADLAAILDRAQPDGSGHEIVAVDGGFADNLPPHGTFAAMFVDLACAAIVHERGDSLVLLGGLATAGPLRVRGLPTRRGALDLAIVPAADGRSAVLTARLPAPALVLWPPDARVERVEREGTALAGVAADRFALPAGEQTWRIALVPAPAPAAPEGARR